MDVYSSDWEVLLNQQLKDVDSSSIRNPEIRNYIDNWKAVKENEITSIENILTTFNYFYDYTFKPCNELPKDMNYIILEIFFKSTTYKEITNKTTTLITKPIDTKYIVFAKPNLKKIEKNDPKMFKKIQETIRPSRWYKVINSKTLHNFRYVIKFDEENYELANETITTQDVETILGGGFTDVECKVLYDKNDLYKIHLEIKNLATSKPLLNFMKYNLTNFFNPHDQNDSIEKTVDFYRKYKEAFPTIIDKNSDIILFKTYLGLLKPSDYNRPNFENHVLNFFKFKSPKARKEKLK